MAALMAGSSKLVEAVNNSKLEDIAQPYFTPQFRLGKAVANVKAVVVSKQPML